ncbi:MAG TPA: aminodeoxychorismate/anthranilate synthase component II [Anseongella sp.]
MEKILILDNYDSFTYNLVHLVREIGLGRPEVHRNDKIALEAVAEYDGIILSPGPGIPSESGILCDLIREYAPSKPIFGVCLGEQAIAEVFGATLINLPRVVHGVAMDTEVLDENDPLFNGIPTRFKSGRYHSWAVSPDHFPDCLRITAKGPENTIMALRHRDYNVCGVQFHPESILTEHGRVMMENWLKQEQV